MLLGTCAQLLHENLQLQLHICVSFSFSLTSCISFCMNVLWRKLTLTGTLENSHVDSIYGLLTRFPLPIQENKTKPPCAQPCGTSLRMSTKFGRTELWIKIIRTIRVRFSMSKNCGRFVLSPKGALLYFFYFPLTRGP